MVNRFQLVKTVDLVFLLQLHLEMNIGYQSGVNRSAQAQGEFIKIFVKNLTIIQQIPQVCLMLVIV